MSLLYVWVIPVIKSHINHYMNLYSQTKKGNQTFPFGLGPWIPTPAAPSLVPGPQLGSHGSTEAV